MVNKFKFGFAGILLVLVLSIISVSAIGAGGMPEFVEISPGQTIDKTLSLQNLPVGEGDLAFKIMVDKGSEYISIIDDEVDVLDGEIKEARIKISVPESANVGDVYNIKIDFKTFPISSTSSESSGTAVQFSLGTSLSFDVKVVEPLEETPSGISTTWIIIGIIVILLAIIIFWIMKKNKSSGPVKK